ncbi:sugar transferase [Qingshengfaniella alkalisoli]|uniref:Sugar transferase n=1 Tax=Qingshengfaniella alkalisoli TaxID=2599296 RepID=A0A5B8IAJ0_9RHOB|nr:sugar transferase [Qingshengfaniella alkalisoli]QDY70306.1 sugar transferase [Qingshengfaniella alkalisoli]
MQPIFFGLWLCEVSVLTAHFSTSAEASSPVSGADSRHSVYRKIGKRALDILFVVFVSPLLIPAILLLALCVALDGGNPFYIQRRIGRNGKEFRMVKLRSMTVNAEEKLISYLASNPEANREWALTQKLRDDPRITRLGRLMRKTSLDELPQFWNVLKGDMSVVGPRPMMVAQRDLYPGQCYFALRPGITGYWQVGDRNNTSFAARARFDSDYYNDISFATDTRVIARTLGVVFQGTGI